MTAICGQQKRLRVSRPGSRHRSPLQTCREQTDLVDEFGRLRRRTSRCRHQSLQSDRNTGPAGRSRPARKSEAGPARAEARHSTIPTRTEELLATFDRCVAEGRAGIDAASDEAMAKSWSFRFAGQHIFTQVRTELIRSFINHPVHHLVHHRAQLGVYLRLQDIPVPGMYGPSADDGWPPK